MLAHKIHQWTICFVVEDLAESIKRNLPIGQIGAVGSSPDFKSRVFHDIWLLGICLETLFICLKQSKLFQIMQHYSTATCSTRLFQMFSASVCIEDRLWEYPLAGGLALPSWAEDIWTSKISLAIEEESLNFGVFATLNLKFFWGSSPRPPQDVTPLSTTLATCLVHVALASPTSNAVSEVAAAAGDAARSTDGEIYQNYIISVSSNGCHGVISCSVFNHKLSAVSSWRDLKFFQRYHCVEIRWEMVTPWLSKLYQ